jgi:hypothetical protein
MVMSAALPDWACLVGALLVVAGCSLTTDLDGLGSSASSGTQSSQGAGAGSGASASTGATTGAGASTGTGTTYSAYASEVMADGPVAYWRLGESRGPSAADASGNEHHGTYVGGVQLGALGALAGDPDTAVDFDGATGFVFVGDALDFPGTAAFTVEAWFRRDIDDTGTQDICGKQANGQGYLLYILNGELLFRRWSDDGIASAVVPVPPVGVFSHVAASYDGFHLRLYVDGREATEPEPFSGQLTDYAAPFVIGANADGQGYLDDTFPGALDEVAVYSKVLPPSRIAAHYAAAVMP